MSDPVVPKQFRWQDVTYRESGRAKLAGASDEGERDHIILEKANGEVVIVPPDDTREIRFVEGIHRDEVTIPARELYRRKHGDRFEWQGLEDEWDVTAYSTGVPFHIETLEFDMAIETETLKDIGIIK